MVLVIVSCISISAITTWNNLKNIPRGSDFKRKAGKIARNAWRVADAVGLIAIILSFPLFQSVGKPNLIDLIVFVGFLLFGTWFLPVLMISLNDMEPDNSQNPLKEDGNLD